MLPFLEWIEAHGNIILICSLGLTLLGLILLKIGLEQRKQQGRG